VYDFDLANAVNASEALLFQVLVPPMVQDYGAVGNGQVEPMGAA
jgi:hypothetical protein